jgi:hypothetical protein
MPIDSTAKSATTANSNLIPENSGNSGKQTSDTTNTAHTQEIPSDLKQTSPCYLFYFLLSPLIPIQFWKIPETLATPGNIVQTPQTPHKLKTFHLTLCRQIHLI